jgi:hypothetical protein
MCCHKCGREVSGIGEEAVKVTCAYCVLKAVGMPEEKKSYISTGRPPGWHFMAEFVDKDGNVFHKGKEQLKLKGTLPPTKVKPPKKRKNKRRTKEQMLVARHKEKKAVLKKAVQKQKDFLNHKINK